MAGCAFLSKDWNGVMEGVVAELDGGPRVGCAGGIARKAPGATGRECARGQGTKSSEASGKPDLDL